MDNILCRDLVMSSDGEELDKRSNMPREKYARTLEWIRDKGFQEFYRIGQESA